MPSPANVHQALVASQIGHDDPFSAFRACGEASCNFALANPGRYRVLFSNRIDLDHSDAPGSGETFDLLVRLVTDVLAELDDDRDPTFVAIQVHTWIHGIVDLCGGHQDHPWPPIDALLDGLCHGLALDAPTRS